MKALRVFNNDHIYNHWKVSNYKEYAELIIRSIFQLLKRFYQGEKTLVNIRRYSEIYPLLSLVFCEWLEKYSIIDERNPKFMNGTLYDLGSKKDYVESIADFISGMTDLFATRIFNEIIAF